MIDRNINSIIFQANSKLGSLSYELAKNAEELGLEGDKEQKDLWTKSINIYSLLEVVANHVEIVDDLVYRTLNIEDDEMNKILHRLVTISGINNFPTVSSLFIQVPPTILTGLPGTDGATGATGPQGLTGLATDFMVANLINPTIVDSFPISSAKAAEWHYLIRNENGHQRTGIIQGSWTDNFSAYEFYPISTADIIGSTSTLEFDITYSGGNINFLANITGGTWLVAGTRMFVPNNGNGSGPVSDVLQQGYLLVGGNTNLAVARLISGDFTIDYLGVGAIGANKIVNSQINSGAEIAYSKLVALNANIPDRVIITDGTGRPSASLINLTDIVATSASAVVVNISTNTYEVLVTDINKKLHFTATSERDITLKQANLYPSGVPIWIRDGTNLASSYPINIIPSEGDSFYENNNRIKIDIDDGIVGIYSDGIDKFYLFSYTGPPNVYSLYTGALTFRLSFSKKIGITIKYKEVTQKLSNMALIFKQMIVQSYSSQTYLTTGNGARIYTFICKNNDINTKIELSDDAGANYVELVNGGGTANENKIAPATLPSVLLEDGSGGIYFSLIGTGVTIRLTTYTPAIMTYVDL